MKRLQYPIFSLLAAMLSAFTCGSIGHAQGVGDLLVAPTRVEFIGRNRTAEVTLVNKGAAEATYRVSFQNMHMAEDGAYTEITSPMAGEKFADSLLRYAPRQIILKPGETQTVRLMVRKPKDLANGEYRSHMLFRAVPPEETGKNIEATQNDGKLAVQLIPIFGVSIPVLVQQGELSAQAAITNASVTTLEGQQALALSFSRTGERSLYGDVKVTYEAAGLKEPLVVGQLRGVSLFYPYPTRTVKVPLQFPEGHNAQNGKLHITYEGRNETDQGKILAEKTL